MIVAIDGPAGAGKSTVAGDVAKAIGFECLDTGAMFRAVAYKSIVDNVSSDDEDALENIAKNCKIEFIYSDSPKYDTILIGRHDATKQIRTSEVTARVTPVCQHPKVRTVLADLQRQIGNSGNYVVEGRDIGTVIFPDAMLKVFLTASPETRAQRRYDQNMQTKGTSEPLDVILQKIIKRDEADSTREIAPLKPAEDSIIVDSTNLNQQQVAKKIISLAKERM